MVRMQQRTLSKSVACAATLSFEMQKEVAVHPAAGLAKQTLCQFHTEHCRFWPMMLLLTHRQVVACEQHQPAVYPVHVCVLQVFV